MHLCYLACSASTSKLKCPDRHGNGHFAKHTHCNPQVSPVSPPSPNNSDMSPGSLCLAPAFFVLVHLPLYKTYAVKPAVFLTHGREVTLWHMRMRSEASKFETLYYPYIAPKCLYTPLRNPYIPLSIDGLYRDNAKYNENYYLGFRILEQT